MGQELLLLLALGSILCCNIVSAQWPQSQESGTLIMAAKTQSAVIVAVDSKISGSSDNISGERKLVDVGERSACAIEGFLGLNGSPDFDVSEALRRWVRSNPKMEAHDALTDLLKAAAGRWDKVHYPIWALPQERKVGNEITELVCGEMINGQPSIFRGETFVQNDGSAGSRVKNSYMGGTLYVEGVLNDPSLYILTAGPEERIPETMRDLLPLRKVINSNLTVQKAIMVWATAASSQSGMDSPTSTWTKFTVKEFFTVVFGSLEKTFPDWVGAPNNVRILSPCGRASTTVDATSWPACPPHRITSTRRPSHRTAPLQAPAPRAAGPHS